MNKRKKEDERNRSQQRQPSVWSTISTLPVLSTLVWNSAQDISATYEWRFDDDGGPVRPSVRPSRTLRQAITSSTNESQSTEPIKVVEPEPAKVRYQRAFEE